MVEPTESTSQSGGQCGCAQLIGVAMMVVLAILGYQFGRHWGVWAGIGGSVVGAILAVPVTGILLGIAALIVRLFERSPD
jgi:hypothetical protein